LENKKTKKLVWDKELKYFMRPLSVFVFDNKFSSNFTSRNRERIVRMIIMDNK